MGVELLDANWGPETYVYISLARPARLLRLQAVVLFLCEGGLFLRASPLEVDVTGPVIHENFLVWSLCIGHVGRLSGCCGRLRGNGGCGSPSLLVCWLGQQRLHVLPHLRGQEVALDGRGSLRRLSGDKVDAEHLAAWLGALDGHLSPAARCVALFATKVSIAQCEMPSVTGKTYKINNDLTLLKDFVLGVDLVWISMWDRQDISIRQTPPLEA